MRFEPVGVSWRQDADLRASSRQRALGLQWPTVEQPSQDEKEVLLCQYSSLFPSPAHLSHTTNINPFENKVWEIYFYKEVCSFIHWSSYIIFDYVSAYICICICLRSYNITTMMFLPFFCIYCKLLKIYDSSLESLNILFRWNNLPPRWLGLVSWHIKHRRLFNVKSSFKTIRIKYTRFIDTFCGYHF